MNLVDYSDSDGSDSEAAPAPKPAPKPAASSSAAAKPAFQKVVDRSNPRKIRVNLPSAGTSGAGDTSAQADEPPAKKARTGGGAFSGFNSFLPAPKKSGEAAAGAAKRGLGKGVSLKTGAAPGFSREPVEEAANDTDGRQNGGEEEDAYGPEVPEDEPVKPAEEVKLVGKPMMFKPLSVANNAKKKKKAASTLPTIPKAPKSADELAIAAAEAKATAAPVAPKPKPKVSLFSISQEESSPVPSASGGDYQPMLYSSEQETTTAHTGSYEAAAQYQSHTTTASQSAGPQSLDTIASDLNLTEAERRQLFGRQRGKNGPDLSAINVVNFNTDQEYAHNEELRASGETVQHNPLRAIAPGKHSLKQLVNAASTQKDALEEHFATGKRNKKEAGSKYGW
ncbi:putative mitotic checkpoint protein prcc protein [Neofusicoccum parvum UCRNP2]|uniref:Putative mitotic checkpoint protein prcc protein n=1 Tax=Botryosphaeria parva (strain UCR-NP2) TaxID=1287680 RepID=R1ET43_BOTPV|nr:putative mitotic checkpoint protein prcc protein [Neofusicoccum parvum UCRNP2]